MSRRELDISRPKTIDLDVKEKTRDLLVTDYETIVKSYNMSRFDGHVYSWFTLKPVHCLGIQVMVRMLLDK